MGGGWQSGCYFDQPSKLFYRTRESKSIVFIIPLTKRGILQIFGKDANYEIRPKYLAGYKKATHIEPLLPQAGLNH